MQRVVWKEKDEHIDLSTSRELLWPEEITPRRIRELKRPKTSAMSRQCPAALGPVHACALSLLVMQRLNFTSADEATD